MGSSFPNNKAFTPSTASARETSIDRIRAYGRVLRRILACSICGRKMSSAKTVRPDTLEAASTLRSDLPMTLRFLADMRVIPKGFGRQFNSLKDFQVAGAAAQIPAERFFDF